MAYYIRRATSGNRLFSVTSGLLNHRHLHRPFPRVVREIIIIDPELELSAAHLLSDREAAACADEVERTITVPSEKT